MGNTHQGKYLIRYLANLDAKTCVLEEKYVDKDYLIDYQKFYSRSFDNLDKFTERVHFFTEDFSEDKFLKSLKNNNIGYLQRSYLGFVVIRPIEGSDGNRLIGRTLLKTFSEKVNGEKRSFIRAEYNVSLFGLPLKVKSLPFQVQDQGVSACATVALWSALHHLAGAFGIPRLSPAEITEMSTLFPSEHRTFPSSGLIWEQIINCVKSLGLDVETIDVENVEDDYIILTAIKAYIKAGLPLIGALLFRRFFSIDAKFEDELDKEFLSNNLKEKFRIEGFAIPLHAMVTKEKENEWVITNEVHEKHTEFLVRKEEGKLNIYDALKMKEKKYDGRHAVVITGYQYDNSGKVTELYVHDDQIGLYSRVKPEGNFNFWENEWDDRGYKVALEKLLIPVYSKIRLTFPRIYLKYLIIRDEIIKSFGNDLDLELYLTTVQEYKKFLLENSPREKEEELIRPLPRFMWVIRAYINEQPRLDLIYDGTSIYPKQLTSITFS
jgi:hypothetical protein